MVQRLIKVNTTILDSPFFDEISIKLPGNEKSLVIQSKGAPDHPYIKSLTVNDRPLQEPIISHKDIANGGRLEFKMNAVPTAWGSASLRPVGLLSHSTSPQTPLCY